MKYLSTLFMVVLMSANSLMAQKVEPLYPGIIPGAKPVPSDFKEVSTPRKQGGVIITKVSEPTLTVYQAPKNKANGTAVIICPGGGYSGLAITHEGYDVAKKFNEIGITAFVLKYRLPDTAIMLDKSFGPLQDVQQAIYKVRNEAGKWNIDPAKVGIMGFSAGGHLASSLSVHYMDVKIPAASQVNLRPDFSILIYPVVSFLESPHTGSLRNLIGKDASMEQKEYFSNERSVNAESPKAFLVQAADDATVPVENSIVYSQALVKAKVPVEIHIYQAGGHGFGLNNPTTADQWFDRLINWLSMNHLLK
ncbi:alpha/beta hydrolase [Pedobacter nutrimenti]|uniref:alpha/beta hydrolase n=1 Tax=Pedobacter nutrimenti TaxID=1241337 RepID=UPI00292F4E29|nr:alpha/beta hydrolase [Pedobacter nutrimenti]